MTLEVMTSIGASQAVGASMAVDTSEQTGFRVAGSPTWTFNSGPRGLPAGRRDADIDKPDVRWPLQPLAQAPAALVRTQDVLDRTLGG
jgi:hypothetical protein